MRSIVLLTSLTFSAALLIVGSGCATMSQRAQVWEAELGPVPETAVTLEGLYREANVKPMLVAKGTVCRRNILPMDPQYITIHSTQNPTGDAYDHALALRRGALRGGRRTGYLFWHFTVQDDVAIQHVPTNESAEHADLDGPGNRHSIGIEMAEHRGNDLAETIDRTAKLTASLMAAHGIPLKNVVPHYHWPRHGFKPPNKNCPHFLLDRGKPRGTWNWFKSRVKRHYDRLVTEGR